MKTPDTAPSNPSDTKKCSNCFKIKVLSEYYVKRGYGHQSRCKSCNAEVCYVWANRNRPHRVEKYLERKYK